jgi:hypothetical protein
VTIDSNQARVLVLVVADARANRLTGQQVIPSDGLGARRAPAVRAQAGPADWGGAALDAVRREISFDATLDTEAVFFG